MLSANKLQVNSILQEYFEDIIIDDFNVDKIYLGICNETYKISYRGRLFVLQKVNVALADVNLLKDLGIIPQKLAGLGWNIPVLLKNKKNLNYVEKNRDIWRIYPYISGNTLNELNVVDYLSVGKILARFHRDLKKINYSPYFSIPHFHDTKFFINSLKKSIKHLEDKKLIGIAQKVIEIYGELKHISSESVQLIHGDSRIENYLFNNKQKAFSIIDFDTFMRGSIFVDIGDLLRSINLTEEQTVLRFSEDKIQEVIVGYLNIEKNFKKEEFIVYAINGMKQITLELCSRFLIDIYNGPTKLDTKFTKSRGKSRMET
jgi:Ser/Thr protein kinase RdoA (MazF antagonist)